MSVVLEFNGKTLEGSIGATLYECLRMAGVYLPSSCSRSGRCGECRVAVSEGEDLLSPRSTRELNLAPGIRLSCQAVILADTGLIHCSSTADSKQRIEDSGIDSREMFADLNPSVKVSGGNVMMDGRVIDRYRGGVLGAALDIGTSTVVLRVADLATGKSVAAESFANPQFFAGSDVISRISFTTGGNDRVLQQVLVERINQALESAAVPVDRVYEMVVAGNPVMRDIFLGLDISGLGQEPFQSLLEKEQKLGARDSTAVYAASSAIGLSLNSCSRIYGLPLPGCHVGGDISAGILASGLAWENRNAVFLDLGTNSEIIVKGRNGIFAASCPAGPAFEGGQIKCGMPALPGAVEAVRILSNRRIQLEVINGIDPAGFCGSGLISLLGEMFRSGLINERGRIQDSLNQDSGEKEILSHPDSSTPVDHSWDRFPVRAFSVRTPGHGPKSLVIDGKGGLFLDEEDISRLLQAKAAITAGIRIALRHCGLGFGEIDSFYLAGAFGRYLNLESASRIGILPGLDLDRFRRLGNSSIEGALIALLSSGSRTEIEKTVNRIIHLELEKEDDFFELYTDGCLLGEMK